MQGTWTASVATSRLCAGVSLLAEWTLLVGASHWEAEIDYGLFFPAPGGFSCCCCFVLFSIALLGENWVYDRGCKHTSGNPGWVAKIVLALCGCFPSFPGVYLSDRVPPDLNAPLINIEFLHTEPADVIKVRTFQFKIEKESQVYA